MLSSVADISTRSGGLTENVRVTENYEGKSISKFQIVSEKRRMGIMTYKPHLFLNVISIQI